MPIYINAIAAAPDLVPLFDAWLANSALPQTNPTSVFDAARTLVSQLPIDNPAATGLVLGTTKGDIQATVNWIRQQDERLTGIAPPILSDPASRLALAANIQGPAYTVSTACSSGLSALIDGAQHLLDGTARHMVAVAYDAATDFVQDGFTALKALSPAQCKPFDQTRDGLSLGSAAAAALLSLTPSKNPIAILSGWALASDATHMTAPDRHANGLIRAIRSALEMAHLEPHDIDVILAHGTGTRYNDAMEATAIDAVFTARACRPPITAVKGLIGHTLGASGLIESALACQILQTQMVPPITHLQTPERSDLNFVFGTPREAKVRHILKLAAGFGGLNAAVILSHPRTHLDRPQLDADFTHEKKSRVVAAASHAGLYTADPKRLTSPDPLAALLLNLADALLRKISEEDRPGTALVLGTTLGCLTADIAFDRSRRADQGRFISPAAFARTLPSTLAAELSVKLNLRGPLLTLTAGNASAFYALERAQSLMRNLDLKYCLAGAADATPPENPTHFRAALVLLSNSAGSIIPGIRPVSIDLDSAHDASLDNLIRWTQTRFAP